MSPKVTVTQPTTTEGLLEGMPPEEAAKCRKLIEDFGARMAEPPPPRPMYPPRSAQDEKIAEFLTKGGRERITKKTSRFKRTDKPEKIYAALIKSGDVQVIRRKGKSPEIRWIKR